MRGLPAVCALVFAAGPALAQDDAWTLDLGAAGRARPTHLGSSRYTVEAVPVVEATYGDRLRLSFDDGAKWSAIRRGDIAFGPIAEYRQSFYDDLPRGAFRIRDVVEVGAFASAITKVGMAEARLRHAVGGYDGWSGDLSFDTGAKVAAKTQVGGQLRLSWADSNFSQEYFGLRPRRAGRLGLPRFRDEDYVTAGGEFDIQQALGFDTNLIVALTADRMLGALEASPLISTRNIYTASIGFTHHWSGPTSGRPQ